MGSLPYSIGTGKDFIMNNIILAILVVAATCSALPKVRYVREVRDDDHRDDTLRDDTLTHSSWNYVLRDDALRDDTRFIMDDFKDDFKDDFFKDDFTNRGDERPDRRLSRDAMDA